MIDVLLRVLILVFLLSLYTLGEHRSEKDDDGGSQIDLGKSLGSRIYFSGLLITMDGSCGLGKVSYYG